MVAVKALKEQPIEETVTQAYVDLTRLIERLHRRFLDVLRTELNRLGITDVNAVQCLLLTNIGEEEVNVRDLMERGYYQGSNASYNIKKLVESGYLIQERSTQDRRSVRLRVSDKGLDLCRKVTQLDEKHAEQYGDKCEPTLAALRDLERVWSHFIAYGAS